MREIEWRYAFEIPIAEDLHNVLHAFFRTSEHGVWGQDEEESSDAFVLHYRRGEWAKSLFGFGKRLVPAPVTMLTIEAAPMRLNVTLRPSPDLVRVGLQYIFSWGGHISAETARFVGNGVFEEVKALTAYVTRAYSLPALPDLRM